MRDMYLIYEITTYKAANQKAVEIQEWAERYNGVLFIDKEKLTSFEDRLRKFVWCMNTDYPRTKALTVEEYDNDREGKTYLHVHDANNTDKVTCIIKIRQVERISGQVHIHFSDEQLSIVRDLLADKIESFEYENPGMSEVGKEYLDIINIIQDYQGYPTFDSLETLKKNTSGLWSEIKI